MPRPAALEPLEIEHRIATLPGWSYRDGRLHRELKFKDFSEAFGFLARGALAAEKLDHHPDWSNSYSKVVIDLSTHDAGGVTELDFRLAAELSALV